MKIKIEQRHNAITNTIAITDDNLTEHSNEVDCMSGHTDGSRNVSRIGERERERDLKDISSYRS